MVQASLEPLTARSAHAGAQRAHVDQSIYSGRLHGADHVPGGLDVQPLKGHALLGKGPDDPDKVDHGLGPGELVGKVRIQDVSPDHLDLAGKMRGPLFAVGTDQGYRLMPVLDQPAKDRSSHKPGPAGYEYSHCGPSI